MKFINYLQTATNSLKANKIRSALTMLGIIIGITSVVTIVSLGSGAQNLIVGQIMSMGSNTIFVEPGSFDTEQKSSMMQSMAEETTIKTLSYKDAIAIKKLSDVDAVAPFIFGVSRMVYKNTNKKITFMGTTPDARKIDNAYPMLGRGIKETDVKTMARIAILGYNVNKELFGDENPIGKTVRIKNVNFKVAGVTEEQGTQMFMNLDDVVYVPLTTGQKLLIGQDHLNWIVARVADEDKIDDTVENIRLILREKHNIYNPENDLGKDDFKVMSQKETANMLTAITSIFTIFLSAVAGIALLVGGIGIMNIMLVSVSERTKEIGLRKAVGAKRKDILYQFLTEAILLTLLGGIIGIILGIIFSYIGGIVIEQMIGTQWVFMISFKAIILAFSVSTIIGIAFGIFPAKKAADLNPIQALRYE